MTALAELQAAKHSSRIDKCAAALSELPPAEQEAFNTAIIRKEPTLADIARILTRHTSYTVDRKQVSNYREKIVRNQEENG